MTDAATADYVRRARHDAGLIRSGLVPGEESPRPKRVQVGWMNPETGVMCDCPVYETSPHAKSVPVYREVAK